MYKIEDVKITERGWAVHHCDESSDAEANDMHDSSVLELIKNMKETK